MRASLYIAAGDVLAIRKPLQCVERTLVLEGNAPMGNTEYLHCGGGRFVIPILPRVCVFVLRFFF